MDCCRLIRAIGVVKRRGKGGTERVVRTKTVEPDILWGAGWNVCVDVRGTGEGKGEGTGVIFVNVNYMLSS